MGETLAALNRLEEPAVRWVVTASRRRPGLAASCHWISRLGNGWIYFFVGAGAVLGVKGAAGLRLLGTAGGAAGFAFLPYSYIKLRLARLRPCDQWPALSSGLAPLDRFSCPSGHCMTLAAVGTPLAWSHPPLIPVILAITLVMAWARIAQGHHYPSDILVGTAIGLSVGAAVSAAFL